MLPCFIKAPLWIESVMVGAALSAGCQNGEINLLHICIPECKSLTLTLPTLLLLCINYVNMLMGFFYILKVLYNAKLTYFNHVVTLFLKQKIPHRVLYMGPITISM